MMSLFGRSAIVATGVLSLTCLMTVTGAMAFHSDYNPTEDPRANQTRTEPPAVDWQSVWTLAAEFEARAPGTSSGRPLLTSVAPVPPSYTVSSVPTFDAYGAPIPFMSTGPWIGDGPVGSWMGARWGAPVQVMPWWPHTAGLVPWWPYTSRIPWWNLPPSRHKH
jgi:hypothetical protein